MCDGDGAFAWWQRPRSIPESDEGRGYAMKKIGELTSAMGIRGDGEEEGGSAAVTQLGDVAGG